MKTTAIICAAGSGDRAGFSKNKMLVPLYGAPVLWHTLKKFAFADEMIVTYSEGDLEEFEKICAPFGAVLSPGGATRTESVYGALQKVTGDIVLVHDGARPFVTRDVIDGCIESVKNYGSGICALAATDTVATTKNGRIISVPDRNTVYELQTPQGFYTTDLVTAYEKAMFDECAYTDDSSIFAKYIESPRICGGSPDNIKLTYPKDFVRGEKEVLEFTGDVGFGTDVHVFGEGSFVRLCGVDIPCDVSLVSHTDGDCAAHAVADALLSAAKMRDIGYYFPDTDENTKGENSLKLLQSVYNMICEKGYDVDGVSLRVEAQKPRIAPFVEDMKKTLAEALHTGADRIAVHAGTAEGLGFVGEGLGIAAYCAANLRKRTDKA
ncbi:MAG: 2-C-methyl-D-erythritol 2,4-cyclodiphosphate synthase [Clostridia bacterium]|nr:2-C-methyl-D-erythritol 2,4-cyclodiphosphate synthase [Clostridia bacterium]